MRLPKLQRNLSISRNLSIFKNVPRSRLTLLFEEDDLNGEFAFASSHFQKKNNDDIIFMYKINIKLFFGMHMKNM